MSDRPLISVIIPTYNCEKTLEIAVQSIIDQSYGNVEIIIVDDASTDGTRSVAESLANKHRSVKVVDCDQTDPYRYDERLKRNVNAGYAARNTGFKHASGEFITFQDADDASLLNRLEVQYELLKKHGAAHVSVDWALFDDTLLSKRLNIDAFTVSGEIRKIEPDELYTLSQKSKGIVAKLAPALNRLVPFHAKRLRVLHKIFFGSLDNYPGPGNSPLFKREVLETIPFRRLSDRVWPSFMGCGADRDWNFQVAETFKNSYVFFIPLYLWRVPRQNERYPEGIEKYIID